MVKNKKADIRIWIIFLLIIILLLIGVIVFFVLGKNRQSNQQILPHQNSPGNQVNAPTLNPIKLLCSTSFDSITWTECDKPITDKAISLGAMYDNGKYFVYYHNGRELYVSLSNNGENWEEKKVVINGIPGNIEPFDPEPVILDNGKYRLYFYEHPASDPGDGVGLTGNFTIGSAISDDGINFVFEPGVRNVYGGIMDPDVIKMGNVWRMYNSHFGIVSFVSHDDGMSFSFEKTLTLDGMITSVIEVPLGYRIYYTSGMREKKPELHSAFSSDGVNWNEEGKVAIGNIKLGERGILSVAAIKTSDKYWVFYGSTSN